MMNFPIALVLVGLVDPEYENNNVCIFLSICILSLKCVFYMIFEKSETWWKNVTYVEASAKVEFPLWLD